ncbi:hypothetical protein HK101_006151 [Irineochytrium annulatum]|nr:hypothetical protein HK101_006151 [Irineochytrium annulatum]
MPGVSIQVQSKIPVGAGLGSSASYSVCVSAGLLLRGNYVKADDAGGFNAADLELINQWALISEKVIHGNPSGIDNTLCTYERTTADDIAAVKESLVDEGFECFEASVGGPGVRAGRFPGIAFKDAMELL